MFNIGDLVTGHNRSYQRSIYQLESIVDSNYGIYKFISYKSQTYDELVRKGYSQGQLFTHRAHNEFRLATKMEILYSCTKTHARLFIFLYKLGATDYIPSL
jgi:hypothetical protein